MMHGGARDIDDVLGRAVFEKRQPTSRVLIPLGAAVASRPAAITLRDNGVVPVRSIDAQHADRCDSSEHQSWSSQRLPGCPFAP